MVIKSRTLRWAGHVARMEEGRVFSKIREVKAYRWEDNIIIDLKEIGISRRNWVDLAQNSNYWRALVNAASSLLIP